MNLYECETLIAAALHPQADINIFQQATDLVSTNPRISADSQLLIYRHNISGGFINALSGTFRTCEIILGKACFATLARDYAWNQPSQHGDLNKLGQDFPDFLQNLVMNHEAFADYSYLADLARLEWLIEKAYQTQDCVYDNLLNKNALETCALENLCPIVNPSVQLLGTDYPVYDIWRMHTQKDSPSQVKGLEKMDHLCVCRDHNDDVIISHISSTLFQVLHTGQTQKSLQSMGINSHFHAPEELAHAIHQGWIIGFKYRESNTDV